jgi:hypothetical protein
MSTWGDPNEAVRKWAADAERQEAARRAAKRDLRRSEEHDTVAHLRAEIANLCAEMQHQREFLLAAVGQALGEISNKMCGQFEAMINKLEGDVRRQFGEAMGRIDALAPDVRSRSKEYKFANERDEEKGIVDLPNPLRPLVRKVTMN